jgi:hypothetical protein
MSNGILITGGTGQLASALAYVAGVQPVGRPEFDSDRPETSETVFRSAAPRVVINAAASPRLTPRKPMRMRPTVPIATAPLPWIDFWRGRGKVPSPSPEAGRQLRTPRGLPQH